MSSVSSRARPFPYSLLINGEGVMIRGEMVGRKLQSLAGTVPTDSNYGSDDLYRERSFVFGRAFLGMGEPVQRQHVGRRYRYARNCWFAGNQRGKGPQWHALGPATTGPVRDFVEALHGGVLTQFILAGRYVLRRNDDTTGGQVLSLDTGAGNTATAAARFTAPGGIDALYVATESGDLWRYDGAVWLGPAGPGGTWNGDAHLLAVVDRSLYIKDTKHTVRRTSADPMVGTNYSGQFQAGDGSRTITGLLAHYNTLIAFLDDGTLVTFNSDGTANDLLPGLATTRAAPNGMKPAADAMGRFYWRIGSSWFRGAGLDGFTVEPIGPERLLENDSPVSGVAQAFAWYGAYYGFWGLYNSATGESHLLQFGDWLPQEDEDNRVFVETFNGSLVSWAGRQISAMRVSSVAGPPRLYCGFTDGTYGWLRLPSNTPNPFAPDSGCTFAAGENGPSECYWPRHTALKEADNKAFLHFQAFGTKLDSDNRVQVAYRTSDAGAYAPLDQPFRSSGQREEFEGDVVATALDVRETFVSPGSPGSGSASTPILEALVLREALRPATRLEWSFVIKAHHRVALRNGATDHRTPDRLYRIVEQAAMDPRSVRLTLPDETVAAFHAVNFEVTIPPEARRYGLARDIAASFVQYRTISTYGTVDRLGELTVDGLGDLTVDDLNFL